MCAKVKGLLLPVLQGVFIPINCFSFFFCSILYVKLNRFQNTGTCFGIVALDTVSWSDFQLRNEFLFLRHFTKMENVRHKQCENSEVFLAEMKIPASLLYAD